MPNAKTHDAIAMASCLPLAPLSYLALTSVGDTPERAAMGTAWLLGAHLVGSFWLSPDLDLDSAIDDRWGPLFWIWWPYMWLVPHRHRIFSHSGFSALIRLGYLYFVILGLLIGWAFIMGRFGVIAERAYYLVFNDWIQTTLVEHRREAFLVASGAVISDLIHTTADYLVTRGKRLLRIFGVRITRDYSDHDRWRPRRPRRRARFW